MNSKPEYPAAKAALKKAVSSKCKSNVKRPPLSGKAPKPAYLAKKR